MRSPVLFLLKYVKVVKRREKSAFRNLVNSTIEQSKRIHNGVKYHNVTFGQFRVNFSHFCAKSNTL
jgi:hypothetical protein